MESIIIKPEQIIIPGEYDIWDPAILQIYFRIFDKGHGRDMPPVLVIHKNNADVDLTTNLTPGKANYPFYTDLFGAFNKRMTQVHEQGKNYFLLDGNHRSLAAALTHNSLNALELQTDKDIEKGEKMAAKGELFNWTIPEITLDKMITELKGQFSNYLLAKRPEFTPETIPLTLQERIDTLISKDLLPQYMKERYLQER